MRRSPTGCGSDSTERLVFAAAGGSKDLQSEQRGELALESAIPLPASSRLTVKGAQPRSAAIPHPLRRSHSDRPRHRHRRLPPHPRPRFNPAHARRQTKRRRPLDHTPAAKFVKGGSSRSPRTPPATALEIAQRRADALTLRRGT